MHLSPVKQLSPESLADCVDDMWGNIFNSTSVIDDGWWQQCCWRIAICFLEYINKSFSTISTVLVLVLVKTSVYGWGNGNYWKWPGSMLWRIKSAWVRINSNWAAWPLRTRGRMILHHTTYCFWWGDILYDFRGCSITSTSWRAHLLGSHVTIVYAEWKEKHGKALGIIKSIFAIISLISSITLIRMITTSKDRFSTTYHHLLLWQPSQSCHQVKWITLCGMPREIRSRVMCTVLQITSVCVLYLVLQLLVEHLLPVQGQVQQEDWQIHSYQNWTIFTWVYNLVCSIIHDSWYSKGEL